MRAGARNGDRARPSQRRRDRQPDFSATDFSAQGVRLEKFQKVTFLSDAGSFRCQSKDMQRAALELTQHFLMRRLAQEEAAARSASNPRARDSHLELARLYRDACNDLDAAPGELEPLAR
jgi:hypothetical protein